MKHKPDGTRVQRPADKKPGKKLNKNWLHNHLNDPYVQAAQRDGYRARAAYKLKEIDEALHLLRPGQVVVDLGSSPGAWSQYLHRRLDTTALSTGAAPQIFALDLLPMQPVPGVHFIQGDFRDEAVLHELQSALGDRRVDVVVSDMAPNLSGHSATDAARVTHLIELAVDFACQHLKPEGALVAKVFHGPGYDALVTLFRTHFLTVRPFKPKSSRDKSAETFLIGCTLKVS